MQVLLIELVIKTFNNYSNHVSLSICWSV